MLKQALGLGSAMTAHPHVLPAGEGSPQRMVTWVWRRCASFTYAKCLIWRAAHGTKAWPESLERPNLAETLLCGCPSWWVTQMLSRSVHGWQAHQHAQCAYMLSLGFLPSEQATRGRLAQQCLPHCFQSLACLFAESSLSRASRITVVRGCKQSLCRARSMIKPFGDADMQISLVEYDAAWRQLGAARFTMPHSFFNPHDFAITPSHYIFFQVAGPGLCSLCLVPNCSCLAHAAKSPESWCATPCATEQWLRCQSCQDGVSSAGYSVKHSRCLCSVLRSHACACRVPCSLETLMWQIQGTLWMSACKFAIMWAKVMKDGLSCP